MSLETHIYFFVHPNDVQGDSFILKGDEFHHAVKALRIRPGEPVTAVNGAGTEYIGELRDISELKKQASCRVIKKRVKPNEPLVDATIIQAVIKGGRFDYFVEKAVEVGVNKILPVETERSLGGAGAQKIQRWRRIALSAMKQSGRSVLTEIADATRWESLIKSLPEDCVKIILSAESNKSISGFLDNAVTKNVLFPYYIAVGPEGGFTEEEIELALKYKFTPVSLGPRRLRSETAGLVALSIILAGDR